MLFIAGLVISGLTAFPVESLLSILNNWFYQAGINNSLSHWVGKVYEGVQSTNANYPFLAYGTDWLAFAHLVIAILFLGPLKDPVKNIWVIEFGIIACVAIFPTAFIAGEIRHIPIHWRLIDCSFGVIGGFLLWYCRKKIIMLESL
jgi:hypothetical protein